MGRRTLLLIASILVAAVGTALIALYVRGADSRAREGTAQVRVYFATNAIEPNTSGANLLTGSLEARTVALKSVPFDAVPEGSTESFRKLITKVGIVEGAPLQLSMFSATGANSPDALGISPGHVAASFELTDPQRVANLLQPGLSVSVYQIPAQGGGDATTAIKKVKVLQIGTQTVSSATSPGSAAARASDANSDQVPRTILTFDLTEDQELKLLTAKRDGELALGLLDESQQPKSGADG